MHTSFTKIAAALLFAIALFSCNFDTMGSDKGAITMRLPDQSQLNAIASSGALAEVSRSVSSGGSISAGAVDQFKVVVRNISSHESITQFVAPGSSITVDELEPGSWDVAIFGYETATGISELKYYGNARGIAVEGGETSNATVGLYNISANMPGFAFNGIDPANAQYIQYAYMSWSCAELGQSGESFYSCSFSAGGDPNDPSLKPPVSTFMEPGYTYQATAFFFDQGESTGNMRMGKCLYRASAQGVVPAAGGLVEGDAVEATDAQNLVTKTTTEGFILGQDQGLASFYQSKNCFMLDDYITSGLSCNAPANASGRVPVVVSYGGKAIAFVDQKIYHPVKAPQISVADMTVTKGGDAKTVVPSYNPPSPINWQIYGTNNAGESNGFTPYAVTSAEPDTWTTTLSSASNFVTIDNSAKTVKGKAAGVATCVWEVTVTNDGDSSETLINPPSEPIKGTANFTVTCVEATQPSGGSSGNYPPDPDWFSFQSTAEVLPEGTIGENDKLAEHIKVNPAARYVNFGNYPRSRKASDVTIDETTAESHTFGNYTYYQGSDGEWYAKHLVQGNSGYYASATPGARGTAVENNGTVAYFKLEPIKWRVLTTNYKNTGYALLITDEAIPGYFAYDPNASEHKRFSYSNNVSANRTIGGKTIYYSNYQYSNARAWLNGLNGSTYGMQDWTDAGFINSAFTEAARMKIKEVLVDNSAASCYQQHETVGTDYDAYLSENTTDKVFLLSIRDVSTSLWGFEENGVSYGTRCFVPTDLAIASGVWRYEVSSFYYGCYCYLRTPAGSGTERVCDGSGYAGNGETAYNDYNNAMVPAICVDLRDLGGAAIGDVGLPNSNVDSHGALPKLFTVGEGRRVKFSMGNLQYRNPSYHFAERQSFYCRSTSQSSSSSYLHDMPYVSASSANTLSIVESDVQGWRILSSAEWQYLLETREGASNKVGVAQVIGLEGLVILPDEWNLPAGLSFTSGFASDSQEFKDINQYTAMQWDKMEKAGAVFLPACGSIESYKNSYNEWSYRRASGYALRELGGYQASDSDESVMQFTKSEITYPTNDYYHSIRLVMDN